MKTKKNIAITLIFILTFSFTTFSEPKEVEAGYPVTAVPNLVQDLLNTASTILTEALQASTDFSTTWLMNEEIADNLAIAAESALIQWVLAQVSNEFATGNDGKPYYVTDWNDYLYQTPQKETTAFIEEKFLVEKLSGGRCGQAGFSAYYQYQCDQGRMAINTYRPVTTLPEYLPNGQFSDPKSDLFSVGSLKAFNAYFQCGNNPYCTSTETKEIYQDIYAMKKEVAIQEAPGGNLGQKDPATGKILAPPSVYADAMSDAIALGNQKIANADTAAELIVAAGLKLLMNNAMQASYFGGADPTIITDEFLLNF